MGYMVPAELPSSQHDIVDDGRGNHVRCRVVAEDRDSPGHNSLANHARLDCRGCSDHSRSSVSHVEDRFAIANNNEDLIGKFRMTINFHRHIPEISAYRKEKEWKPLLHSLKPSECCELVAKRLIEQKNSLRAVSLLMEKSWWELERPYYNVWPSVFQMIEDVDLDVPMRCLSLPYPSMAVCFSEGTKYGLASCLVSVIKYENQLVVSLAANVFWNGELLTVWRWGKVKGDEPFSVFARCRDDAGNWKRQRYSEEVMSEEEESRILDLLCHIFCGVSILANDSTLVQPIVLNRDLMKYKSADEATKKYLEDRAARINGRGFGVGEKLESELKVESSVSPHIRKPHMALFWTGKGRTIPVLQLRRGAYIHRSDVTKVPTGYMDREEELHVEID